MALALLQLRMWLSDRDDRGASLVEYALLLALIAIVCVVAVGFLGDSTDAGISAGGSAFSN
jgi:pilus assembly protein Flp/PilA